MRRREFITLIGGAAASPLVARAQQPAKTKRIAWVSASDPVALMVASYHPFYQAFFDEVSRLGFVEGKNLVVERYSAEGETDRFPKLVRDIVDTRPDAIYAADGGLAFLFKSTKTTIPIVTITADPVALGFATSIARPGGNITGTSVDAGLEIWGKRIGLLKEALPKMSNLCLLLPMSQKRWEVTPYSAVFRQAAKAADIALTPALLEGKIDEAAYLRVFAAFEEQRPDALLVTESSINLINASTIVELAAKHNLPAMYTWRDYVEIGGLMSHAMDLAELGRSSGYQMGQVLSGANPGDVPFLQVTRLYLTLNLKTAKSLGIEFPAALLGSADFVIE
jgi:ABC-type uncharacterized transport system substrate-binding protein